MSIVSYVGKGSNTFLYTTRLVTSSHSYREQSEMMYNYDNILNVMAWMCHLYGSAHLQGLTFTKNMTLATRKPQEEQQEAKAGIMEHLGYTKALHDPGGLPGKISKFGCKVVLINAKIK